MAEKLPGRYSNKSPYIEDPVSGKLVKKNSPRGKEIIKAKREKHVQDTKVGMEESLVNQERLKRLEAERLEKLRLEEAKAKPVPPPVWVPQTDEELLKAMAIRGEEDLYFFATEICEYGYNGAKPDGPRITEDQKEACQFLQQNDPVKWIKLYMTPRDTLKTTVLQAYVLWRLVRNPNYKCLLYGEVHDQARKRLAGIKKVITSCKTFRDVYGDLDASKKPGYSWNENELTVATKTSHAVRESSVETAGLDVVVNQRHFDEIIVDDIESEDNTKTRDQIDAIKKKFELLMPLASRGSRIVVAGVFWSDSDVHCWLREDKTVRPHIDEFVRPIYLEDGITPRFKNNLPAEEIARKKAFLRTDIFSCQYMLDPVSAESQKFKKEYFTYVPKSARSDCQIYLLIDQAGDPTSERANTKDSDFIGMAAVAITKSQDIIALDFYHGKVSPTEAVEQAITLVLRHRPMIIGVERAGIGNMAFYLREELRKRGIFAVVEDVSPQGRSKYQRIMALEPIARRRKIYISETAQMADEFLDEITRYPKAKNDDIVDAFAYTLDLLVKYGLPVDYEQVETWREKIKDLDPNSQQYWAELHRAEDKGSESSFATEFFG